VPYFGSSISVAKLDDQASKAHDSGLCSPEHLAHWVTATQLALRKVRHVDEGLHQGLG